MLKHVRLLILALVALGAAVGVHGVLYANDATCTGVIGVQRFENLEVPAGAACTLNGTRIDGNIKVYNNATLTANEVVVGGNVQAEGAASVTVNSSRIGGSVQIKQGGGATVDQTQVDGDIQLESNSRALGVTFNRVGGNIQVFQNRGGATISDNVINGNLQCKENTPAPAGGRNRAASYEDQCAGFGGTPNQPTPTSTPSPSPTPTATPSPGGDETCVGVINGGRFENLEVPANASCTLNRTVVDGNIKVKTGATLHAVEVRVGGNIQAEGAAAVTVNNYAQVGGSIQIKQGGSATVEQVKVNGDIQLESNRGALLVEANRVGGNIQVFQNIGLATIFDNVVDGNLQCKENNPAPIGGRNVAASYEDQCAGFAGEPATPPAPTPGPSGIECRGVIGAQQVANLVIPDNASCILHGTRVSGDIVVGANAALQGSAVNVAGNVRAQGAAVVTLNNNSVVDGDVQVRQSKSATLDQVWVGRNLQLESNDSALTMTRNRVAGDMRATGNRAGVVVRNNKVSGVLHCSANQLQPVVDANQAGASQDQCTQFNQVNLKVYLPAVIR